MEVVYRQGISVLQVLQNYGEPYSEHFQTISAFCDPRYAFLVYPPLFYALCQNAGRSMLLVVIVTEWMNMVLKWILMGHRPYWWVMENLTPSSPNDTIIKQFPLTCETGPGSPSGHSQLQSALNYTIVYFLTKKVFKNSRYLSTLILYPAYIALVVAVSLSRLYIAAHFPHQCVLGALIGFAVSYALVDLDISKWRRRHYLGLTLFLFLSTMATNYILEAVGVNVLSTIGRAQKWCANPAWVHVDTTPYFSMTRFLGFCAGLGFATTCKLFSIADQKISTGSRIILALSVAGIGKLSENIDVAFRELSPLPFYTVAFSFNVVLAYALFSVVPYTILKLVGVGIKVDEKKQL